MNLFRFGFNVSLTMN